MMCWWILLVWIGCYYFNSVEYLPNRLLVGQGLGHDVCLCSLCYHLCFTWACCYPQSRSSVLQCLPRALCFSRRVLFLIWIFQLFVVKGVNNVRKSTSGGSQGWLGSLFIELWPGWPGFESCVKEKSLVVNNRPVLVAKPNRGLLVHLFWKY